MGQVNRLFQPHTGLYKPKTGRISFLVKTLQAGQSQVRGWGFPVFQIINIFPVTVYENVKMPLFQIQLPVAG
jgi:ABC-type branched-subunit amino acid transport system ATPase component